VSVKGTALYINCGHGSLTADKTGNISSRFLAAMRIK
jgi:hypothetical protein